jgi:DNA-3-methyladenine glycosylase I
MSETEALAGGADGRLRCWWAIGSADNVSYHDLEWGRPQLADAGIFEHLALEAFQSGLSWAVVLRKRSAFRAAFCGWDLSEVAAFGPADVERLLRDVGIVRNRRKIEAVIHNAARAAELIEVEGSLAAFFWRFRPPAWPAPRSRADVLPFAPASESLAIELRRRGFRFLGPTTVHAHMQSTGLLNDHIDGCCVREAVEQEQVEAARRLHVSPDSAAERDWSARQGL